MRGEPEFASSSTWSLSYHLISLRVVPAKSWRYWTVFAKRGVSRWSWPFLGSYQVFAANFGCLAAFYDSRRTTWNRFSLAAPNYRVKHFLATRRAPAKSRMAKNRC